MRLGYFPFLYECIRSIDKGKQPIVSGSFVMNLGGLRVNLDTGVVRLGSGLLVTLIGEFLKHWLYLLVKFTLRLCTRGAPIGVPATLAFGIGEESLFVDGSDARFVAFCKHGPIAPLARMCRSIIETALVRTSTDPEHFQYELRPLVALAMSAPMKAGDRIDLLVRHLRMVGKFFGAVLGEPLTALLGRDLAYAPLVQMLDQLGAIEAIVITNANYNSQPLWMRGFPGRRFAVHMVWYSQNIKPHVYASDGVVSDLPHYRHVFADVSWVWTAGHAGYLKRLGIPGEMRVVGPVVWHLPEKRTQVSMNNEVRIAVFDVTPVTREFAKKIGRIKYYYRVETMVEFIRGIVSIRTAIQDETGKRVRILVKHKREHQRIHDPRYRQLIEELVQGGDIELIPSQENIYSMLSGAHWAIVIPYSSPAYIASYMGRPAIYYDPLSELLPTHEPAPNVSFAAGRAELLVEVLKRARDSLGQKSEQFNAVGI